MSSNKLNDFRDIINGIEDLKSLESGYGLMHDLIKISSLKKEIESLEENLVSGGRAMFYYFAMSLDEEEYPYIAEKIKGRMNRLSSKEKRERESLDDGAKE